MSTPDSVQRDAQQVTRIITLATDQEPLWDDADLHAIFMHQMAALLDADLSDYDASRWKQIAPLCHTIVPGIQTFGNLLDHPAAPLDALNLVKDFAKSHRASTDSPIPSVIATTLYFLACAAALVHRQTRISSMDDGTLRDGWGSVAALPWIDTRTRRLLQAAVECLRRHA